MYFQLADGVHLSRVVFAWSAEEDHSRKINAGDSQGDGTVLGPHLIWDPGPSVD